MILVYRYRVKSNLGALNRQARAVNFVWNFVNDTQRWARKWERKWPTGYDLAKLCAGSSKELGLLSSTIDKICQQYERSRKQHNRPYLRYRGRKSLGWIPLKANYLHVRDGTVIVGGRQYRLFYSRPIPDGAKIVEGCSFGRDALGNWYINLAIELPDAQPRPILRSVGIDLGIKSLAALSDGTTIENPRHFAALENKLAVVQRARKKLGKARISAKIANRRKDALHKLSHRIVRDFDYIAVGNVNAAGLAQTKVGKSVLDASWSTFRNQLAYKSIRNGAHYEEVDEAFSTRVCSSCGCETGPKGVADLGIRSWSCGECGAVHDRDINSAINILTRSGHRAPVEGVAA